MKFVKPSELSLDLINTQGKGIKHNTVQPYLGPLTSNNQLSANMNVQNILNNMKTPQNQILTGYNKSGMGKELPGIVHHNRSSSNNRNGDELKERSHNDLLNSYAYKKRNVSTNNRNMIPISHSLSGV